MKVMLDTHILLWWLMGEGQLSKAQEQTLERMETSGQRFAISAISLWEIAKLVERGRISMKKSIDVFFEDLEEHPRIEISPLSPKIALESTRLGSSFPKDPADQIIAATARVLGLTLLTADQRILASQALSVLG